MTDNLRHILSSHREWIIEERWDDLLNLVRTHQDGTFDEMFNMFREADVYSEFDNYLQQFLTKLETVVDKVEKKYRTGPVTIAGFSAGLVYHNGNVYEKDILDKITRHDYFFIRVEETGDIPDWYINNYDNWRLVVRGHNSLILKFTSLTSEHVTAATIPVNCGTFPYVTSFDIMNPEKWDNILKEVENVYDTFCNDVVIAWTEQIKSFDYKKTIRETYVNDIIDHISEMLNGKAPVRISVREDVILSTPDRLFNENNITIFTGLQNSRGHIVVSIPTYKAPSEAEIKKQVKKCDDALNRYFKNQAKIKELQVDTNTKETFKHVTRKDINSCMKELGIEISNTVYTNKYPNITTYKYEGLQLSTQKCEELYDKLVSIGANVDSVECKVSGSGWRSYTSLFVRIKN